MKVTTGSSKPEFMTWDTEFFGLRVGRALKLDGLTDWARDNTIDLVCLLVDADRIEEAQAAEERGYRLMDVRVTLERQTYVTPASVRLARAEDTARLRAIAREAFHLTRFYADPTLDNKKCDELYDEWTRASCAGGADVVLVADREEIPIGYITANVDGPRSEIGLVATAADYRGQGVGNRLVKGAIDWAESKGAETMSVVTQGRNIGAIRTFEGCGFRTVNTSLWFHKRVAHAA